MQSSPAEECIKNCTECHRSCKETMMHCLSEGGEHAELSHIRTLLECAELCKLSAGFMIMESPLHGSVCGICAEACELCADSCETVGGGEDEMMKECEEVCRRCAESCRKMAV